MSKSFKLGIATGFLASAAAVAGAALGYRQMVVKPEQEAEDEYNEVSKAAVRRSVAAHQSRF
ncbi:DUF3042 family protein [Eupransor demetentiae]|uniref:DUF3042 family protein n=1 Tax=Eupransor demetentiae TaxID=3109584 RepID=A0ABM9N550_9LACO|nr:hypothetical protein R54876_GBNLAHCA_00845 [Lactobacillaceae bacterium LMG 33000]